MSDNHPTNHNKATDDLKPCPTPWCDGKGGAPYVFERRFDCLGVYCPSCSVSTDYHPNTEAAVRQWNTRALEAARQTTQGGRHG